MSAGGWRAIRYSLSKAREAGGLSKFWKAMRSKNACKTCALGMGGQRGGMVNELGRFPEVCKKSMQAMAADMQPAIDPGFWRQRSIHDLRGMSPRQLESCGRLVQPLRLLRGEDHWKPIDWEEALQAVADRLKSLSPEETFWYFSGRSSNEAGFLLQLMARAYGANNINNCSYYCHQASGVGLKSAVGSGTATVVLDDVEHADLVFVIGGNPPSNHPRLMTVLADVRRRGGRVIVINPVVEQGLVTFHIPSRPLSLLFGTKIATRYVQPHIGGDLALLWGVAKKIDEMGAADSGFLRRHCEGHDAWEEHLRQLSWREIEAKSGVSRSDIESIAADYAAAKNAVFSWTMGITHHAHGVQNVQAIANLALQRGMVGKPNAGLLPIRGHSNVQGIGSVGATPKLTDAVLKRTQDELNITLPEAAGMDTLACMEAAEEGRVKLGLYLGGNLYGSNPDSHFAQRALSNLQTQVFLNTTLNTGHAWGLAEENYLLPVLARDEEPEPTTQESMFNFVRLSDGGPRRHDGPLSEVELIAELGSRALGEEPIDWRALKSTSEIRRLIGAVVPGYGAISRIDTTKQEFQIDGRTFHQPTFPTSDGKARLHVHALPELQGEDGMLRLMTVRSEGQFNTVVYEEEDIYRGQTRRDVILIHPDDLRRMGLQPQQHVSVVSDTGRMDRIIAQPFKDIRRGNVLMYYPEANALVARRADPESKTPAFKGVLVRLEPD